MTDGTPRRRPRGAPERPPDPRRLVNRRDAGYSGLVDRDDLVRVLGAFEATGHADVFGPFHLDIAEISPLPIAHDYVGL
jgi:hypothetical protein